jgi:hypothetical protein
MMKYSHYKLIDLHHRLNPICPVSKLRNQTDFCKSAIKIDAQKINWWVNKKPELCWDNLNLEIFSRAIWKENFLVLKGGGFYFTDMYSISLPNWPTLGATKVEKIKHVSP